jgi:hypothetical protein
MGDNSNHSASTKLKRYKVRGAHFKVAPLGTQGPMRAYPRSMRWVIPAVAGVLKKKA